MSIDAEVLLYADLNPLGCLEDKFGYFGLTAEVADASVSVSALLSGGERKKKSEPKNMIIFAIRFSFRMI